MLGGGGIVLGGGDGANPPFGECSGWTDVGCGTHWGFANDDIFFLEVCVYSEICANQDELFRTRRGEEFQCALSQDGFEGLRSLLLQ